MKKLLFQFIFLLLSLCLALPLYAIEFSFHGDLNHRFQYTNRADFLTLDSTTVRPVINDGDVDENFGELKYRLWAEAASDDGDIKGVVGTEIGGLRFGEPGNAPFSGDQVRFEVRWAYTDIQLPMVERAARFKIGLQPFLVNKYIWQETAAGVDFTSTLGDRMDYQLAWMRGSEFDKTANRADDDDDRTDLDAFLARLNIKPADGTKAGAFIMYEGFDSDDNIGTVDSRDWEVKLLNTGGVPDIGFDLWSLGLDGSFEFSSFFVNWDLIYQIGEFQDVTFTDGFSGAGRTGDFDLSAYFLHFDLGAKFDKVNLTYTFWYASGDDDPADDDFNAFIATDVDMTESITLFEGNYADDNYFTERPYIADKGFIMNRIGLDYKTTEKLTLGGALMYMLTAEDIEYTAAATGTPASENELGWEIGGYAKYLLFKSVEVAVNGGYLFAGDALDAYEVPAIQDGSSDENIFITSARVRFTF
jgi:hypothetical protein